MTVAKSPALLVHAVDVTEQVVARKKIEESKRPVQLFFYN